MDAKTLMCFAIMAMKQGREKLACDILKHTAECDLSEFMSVGQDGQGIDGLNSYVDEVWRMPTRAEQGSSVPPSENTLAPSLHGNSQGPNLMAISSNMPMDDIEALDVAVAAASSAFMQSKFVDDGDILLFGPYVSEASASKYTKPLLPGPCKITI